MKLHMKEAEGDYVRIGNMVLPKNAADFGYADYDTVAKAGKRNYEAEKEAERKAHIEAEKQAELAKLKAGAEDLYTEFLNCLESSSNLQGQLEAIDDLLIPEMGKADTKAGEIMRCIQRLLYRDYNDGDKFYNDYGLETCASSAAYLMDETTGQVYDILRDAMDDRSENDAGYTKMLNKVARLLINYLKDNSDLFGEPSIDSRNYTGGSYDMIQEAGHSYEFEISTGYYETLGIDDYAIKDFVDGCASSYPDSKTTHPYRDYYVITNLTHEDYMDLDRNFSDWEEEFISENSPEEDEEDWEDEE